MATVKTYDTKCFELAEFFLADCPDICTEAAKITMAQQIQQTIEDEIDFMRSIEGKVQ
jgi:hypothetical protein